MKKKLLLSFIILFCIMIMPMGVEAKTSKKCEYYVNENQLGQNSSGGTINCTFTIGDPFFFGIWGKGAFSYSCKYKKGSDENMTILIGNYNSEKNTGFNLEEWFRKNESCPRYLVFNQSEASSRGSTYAANTNKQVDKIRKKYGQMFTPYLESSIRDEEIKDNPDSEAAQACTSKKEDLEAAMALLEGNRNKLIEKGCQNYELTEEERDTVASPDKIQLGRECKQITDNYNITVASARSTLNDYVNSGCLDEESAEYEEYKNKIKGLEEEVEKIDDNIDEQNGVYDDEWEELGEDIGSGDCGNPVSCPDIINMEEGHIGWILNTILNYIKIIGPILVVLLSAIDFIKAVVGTDEKAMKDAQSKLVIRLVATVCLFLVPTLIQLLLSFINATNCTFS